MEVLWDVAITKKGERIWIDDDCKETVFCPECKIGDYSADVLFEDKWAFEVVYSNPPSDEKMNDWRDDLIIFNFYDETVWGGRVYEEICPTTQFFHIKPKPRSFAHVVQSFARDILAGKEVDVCAICREVKYFRECNSFIEPR
ncbi:MAG: hypothetical protein VW438_02700 [Euryarchaeota archaeon]